MRILFGWYHLSYDLWCWLAGRLEAAEASLPLSAAQPVAESGLRPAPLAGSIKNATARYDLPSPALAVRNLVLTACFCLVLDRMSAESEGPKKDHHSFVVPHWRVNHVIKGRM